MVNKSIIFDFIRTPNFLNNMNQSGKFNVNKMDGQHKYYEFVLASNCADNIEDNLDGNGNLKTDGTISKINIGTSGQVILNFTSLGGNNRQIVSQSTNLVIDMGDVNTFLKGVFLREISTTYPIAYCIFETAIPVTGTITIPKNSVIWTINDESSRS